MRTISDVLDALAEIAPFEKAASWDPVGLQFGEPGRPCRAVAVCHEVTEDVVRAVAEHPVDLLVAYHPLLFRPTTRLVAGPGPAGRAYRLIRAGVDLAVVHTAFDVAPGGAADALATSLGLSGTRPFGPLWGAELSKIITFLPPGSADAVADAMSAAGAGRIGAYASCSFRTEGTGTFRAGEKTSPAVGAPGETTSAAESRLEMMAPRARVEAVVAAMAGAHPYEEPAYDVVDARGNASFVGRIGSLDAPAAPEELAGLVESVLGAAPRVARAGTAPIREVAVVPGSGRSFIEAAARAGADALVTGDVGHHDAVAARDAGLTVVDPGHVATERPGVAALYAAVSRSGEAVDLTSLAAAPWEER